MRKIELTDEDSRFVENVLRTAPLRDADDRSRAKWIADELAKVNRRWLVQYDLAYDGGGSSWSKGYRTIFGARIAMWWNQHVTSWGGSAKLIDTDHEVVPTRHPEPDPNGLGWS